MGAKSLFGMGYISGSLCKLGFVYDYIILYQIYCYLCLLMIMLLSRLSENRLHASEKCRN